MAAAIWEALRRAVVWLGVQILLSGPSMPRHIAIIMDGNRRFADRAGIDRKSGHGLGYDSLIHTLELCLDLGVRYVTVYAFSIDNFGRSPEEVSALMELMREKLDFLVSNEGTATAKGIKVCLLGDLELLPEDVRAAANRAMLATKNNSRAVLNLCVAYTSTQEIVAATKGALKESLGFTSPKGREELTKENIERHLYTAGCPSLDLLIRTSGETRLSNFMLWQSSNSQLAFCDVLWPDFSFRHLFWIIFQYQRNNRSLEKHKLCDVDPDVFCLSQSSEHGHQLFKLVICLLAYVRSNPDDIPDVVAMHSRNVVDHNNSLQIPAQHRDVLEEVRSTEVTTVTTVFHKLLTRVDHV